MLKLVIPAGKRVSSAMDGKLKSFHGAWIPAIHAGMTNLENSDHVIWQSRIKGRINTGFFMAEILQVCVESKTIFCYEIKTHGDLLVTWTINP